MGARGSENHGFQGERQDIAGASRTLRLWPLTWDYTRKSGGGGDGIRTHVKGFAGPCLNHSATPPESDHTSGLAALIRHRIGFDTPSIVASLICGYGSTMTRIQRRIPRIAIALVAATLGASCSSSSSRTGASTTTNTTRVQPTTTVAPTAGRPFTFTHVQLRIVDTTRTAGTNGTATFAVQRDLLTELYLPTVAASAKPRPLIMFSHGNKGNPNKFTQLFEHWAQTGYVVAAPRFPRTSNEGIYDFVDYPKQPGDISFVLTELLQGKYAPAIDKKHIAAAGLSLGGGTTYALAYNPCCVDDRFASAAIFDGLQFQFDQPFGVNKIPVLIMHIDTDLVLPYKTAVDSYQHSASPKFFVTLFNGIHPEPYEDTPSDHDETTFKVTTDFFDLTLLGDLSGQSRMLRDGNIEKESKTVAG